MDSTIDQSYGLWAFYMWLRSEICAFNVKVRWAPVDLPELSLCLLRNLLCLRPLRLRRRKLPWKSILFSYLAMKRSAWLRSRRLLDKNSKFYFFVMVCSSSGTMTTESASASSVPEVSAVPSSQTPVLAPPSSKHIWSFEECFSEFKLPKKSCMN